MKAIRFSATAANGPDWCDVSAFMKELYRVHSIDVRFELRTGVGHYVGAVAVRLLATAPHLTAPGRVWSVELNQGFPNNGQKTLEGTCFYLLQRLDHLAARELWSQKPMWPDA